MPLQRCENTGWRWGKEGKCYKGPEAKKKAIKQGLVIEGPQKFQEMAYTFEEPLQEKDIKDIADAMYDEGYSTKAIVATSMVLTADQKAGYPPNCNEGYVEADGKCIPKPTVDE